MAQEENAQAQTQEASQADKGISQKIKEVNWERYYSLSVRYGFCKTGRLNCQS